MVCAEEVVDDPGQPPHPFGDAELAASAAGLARLVTVAAELPRSVVASLAMHPLRDACRRACTRSRTARCSTSRRRAAGAEWIDDLARIALVARDSDRTAAGRGPHRLVGSQRAGLARRHPGDLRRRLVVARRREHRGGHRRRDLVRVRRGGRADRTVARGGGQVGRRRTSARAGRLSRAQRHAAGGSILYSLAYTARCEHAVEVGHPELGRPRRARDRSGARRRPLRRALRRGSAKPGA